ncbi:MAG: DNA polymerase [Psychrobacillus sp.]
MDNPYLAWQYHYITDADKLYQQFLKDAPKSIGFDTESTGLHIIKDKPFLFQLGWGRVVYLFDPTPEFMKAFFYICKNVKWAFAHNLGYDLNMCCNLGYMSEVLQIKSWCDSITVMRLALEAKSARDGGDGLGLKDLGVKYIHPYANNSEQVIKAELKKLNDERVKVLSAALKQFDKEGSFTPTGKQKKWGKGDIEKFLKDPTNEVEDLPEGVRAVWLDWQEDYPEPTYADIPSDKMRQYAGEDVATMLMLMEYAFPIITAREQLPILNRERKCILPTLKMEREGLEADLVYLEESRLKVKAYIVRSRARLVELAGEDITVGQHARIRQIFDEKWGIVLDSADKTTMKQVIKNFDGEPKEFATIINRLRNSEKWYSTYIKRVQKLASYDGRAYTQINLSGAISGRMSSDFQQFPKDVLKDENGEVLFSPRRAFKVGGPGYKMYYLDFDQIELVGQSHYCVLMKSPGVNLPRAYMPYRCRHYLTGEIYLRRHDYKDLRHLDKQPNGDSVWLMEDETPWTKTDMHTLTASKAYPDVDPMSEEFKKKYRPKGKTTNFASNYGGGAGALMKPLDIEFEEAEKLSKGYQEAYPEVGDYQQGIIKAHAKRGYVQNQYGRRYYLKDSRDAYKLANYVVQGSCADALKEAIVDIDEFIESKKLKSSIVLPVHDELQFKVYDDEEWIVEHLLHIMQDAFSWCLVPVTAGVEVSSTYWSDKKEVI